MKPKDIIFWRDEQFGKHRFWEVIGVFHGALGQESLIEIQSLTERPGTAYGRDMPASCFVPEPLLRNVPVFAKQELKPCT